jgi:hypothetical protein
VETYLRKEARLHGSSLQILKKNIEKYGDKLDNELI